MSDIAVELHERASALLEEHRLEEARSDCERSLELFVEAEGERSPDVANVMCLLAEIVDRQGQWDRAADLALGAIGILDELREVFSGEDADRIRLEALSLAGNAYRQAGRYAEAGWFLGNAITHCERAFGADDPAVSRALNNLAVLYKYTGEFEEAEGLYRRALAILEDVY